MANESPSRIGAARRLAALLLVLLVWIGASVARAQVGAVVNEHRALGSIAGRSLGWLERNQPVEFGLNVNVKEPKSLIDLSLWEPITAAWQGGKRRVFGSFHFADGEFTIEPGGTEPATGNRYFLGLLVPQGSLWMAVKREASRLVSVATRQLTAFTHGTSFRMLVDPIVGTFVAVDEGEVQAALTTSSLPDAPQTEPDSSRETLTITAGHWLLVPPNGTIQRGANDRVPSDLEDPPLIDCCDFRTGGFFP